MLAAMKVFWPHQNVPQGKIFKGKQAKQVIDQWKGEQQVVLKKQGSFIKAAEKTEKRLVTLGGQIGKSAKEVKKAKGYYKSVKTPMAKARWARRLILATELHTYVRQSHQKLNSTVTRIKDAIEDGRLVIDLIENQIKDAQMYYEIEGQVKLVGQAFAAAKERHVMPDIQYSQLEVSIEGLEAEVNRKTDDELIAEADRLLATPQEGEPDDSK